MAFQDPTFVELSHGDFVAGIVPAVQRELFAHWDSLRGDARMPERRSFRPEKLPRSLVPHIGLLKVDRAAERLGFEYRIVGNAIARTFGTGAPRKRPADDRSRKSAQRISPAPLAGRGPA